MDNMNVLIVEDNIGDRRIIEEAFRHLKNIPNLMMVEDGAECLKALKGEHRYENAPRPNLIILDLNLPGRDGREVLAEIKSDAGLRKIPVIVLTSSMSPSDVAACYDRQASCFITKPSTYEGMIKLADSLQRFWALRMMRIISSFYTYFVFERRLSVVRDSFCRLIGKGCPFSSPSDGSQTP